MAAALLVVVALGLFVWGVVTGATAFYWACVVVSAVAAVLLILARRRLGRPVAEPERREERLSERLPERSREPVRQSPEEVHEPVEPAAPQAPAARQVPAVHDGPGPESEVAPVADAGIPVARHASRDEQHSPDGAVGDPPVEEVEVTDLLLVVDLTDEVFVIDEHPRYHLEGCPHLAGAEPFGLPVDEARTDGFTPCGICSPDRTMAERERARRAGRPTS